MTHIYNEAAYERATKARIIANAQKTWRANTERAEEIEDALQAGRTYNDYGNFCYTDNFIGSLARAFDTYGKLTPNQSAAVLKGIDARAARKAEWADKTAALNATRQHLGTVGEKITLTLTLKKIVSIDSAFGLTFINILEDDDQNVVIYKGNSAVFNPLMEGQQITLTATVKEHGVRNGTKQTVIQRPKAAK